MTTTGIPESLQTTLTAVSAEGPPAVSVLVAVLRARGPLPGSGAA